MTALEKVQAEIARYDHALLRFSARERDGVIELVIDLKQPTAGTHRYYAPIHQRDIDHSQFSWTFQRYLYDCMHDYLVEMFLQTPKNKDRWK